MCNSLYIMELFRGDAPMLQNVYISYTLISFRREGLCSEKKHRKWWLLLLSTFRYGSVSNGSSYRCRLYGGRTLSRWSLILNFHSCFLCISEIYYTEPLGWNNRHTSFRTHSRQYPHLFTFLVRTWAGAKAIYIGAFKLAERDYVSSQRQRDYPTLSRLCV